MSIYEALTAQRHGVMHDVNPLPRGRWLLCGWTPLSRALRHRLQGFDIDFHVIDANADAVRGRKVLIFRGDGGRELLGEFEARKPAP